MKQVLAAVVSFVLGSVVFAGDIGALHPDDVRTYAAPSSDAAIELWQSELLDIAQRAASALPAHPHLKTRAKAQEAVVDAALALDQGRRALAYADKIDNWRGALAFAKIARWSASRGDLAGAERQLGLARAVLGSARRRTSPYETHQEWMFQRFDAVVAEVELLLGRGDEAAARLATVGHEETDGVRVLRSRSLRDDDFDAAVDAIDERTAQGGIDPVRQAIAESIALIRRFEHDREKRERLEERALSALAKLPRQAQIHFLVELSAIRSERGEADAALAHVAAAEAHLDAVPWLLEDALPARAILIVARHRAGDGEGAAEAAARALAGWERDGANVVDVFRGAALRPLAEALHRIGDRERSLALYREIVEHGSANPNGRPRAEDLVATCCSLAVSRIEPDADLMCRLRAAFESLRAPW